MSIAERLDGKRVVICAGSGGVGKTTTSAALAMGLAASGKRVAVVTIDPARRLADSLGLEDLGNEPRLVDPARLDTIRQRQSRLVEYPLWDSPYLFIFVLACLSTEWALRKKFGLA